APAGGLPGLERAERPTVAPADRQVHVARGVGNRTQVVGAVVEQIAEHGPQELRLRVSAGAQRGELLRRVALLEQRGDFRVELRLARPVVLRIEVEYQDVLAALGVDARTGLLAQRALGDQRL